jgi:hypothetical protein
MIAAVVFPVLCDDELETTQEQPRASVLAALELARERALIAAGLVTPRGSIQTGGLLRRQAG